MELRIDINDLKNQVISYIDNTRIVQDKVISTITKEIATIRNENEKLVQLCQEWFSKYETIESKNTSLISEPAQIPTSKPTHFQTEKKSSKINIQNWVINKKVQISKEFSRLKIKKFRTSSMKESPEIYSRNYKKWDDKKGGFWYPMTTLMVKNKNKIKINEKTTKENNKTFDDININHQYKKLKTNIEDRKGLVKKSGMNNKYHPKSIIKGKSLIKDIKKEIIHTMGKNRPGTEESNYWALFTEDNENNNRNRKLSIIDIPAAFTNEGIEGRKALSKKEIIFKALAKSNVLPLKSRVFFSLIIPYVYSTKQVIIDYISLINTKLAGWSTVYKTNNNFIPCLTLQIMLNLLNKPKEKQFLELSSTETCSSNITIGITIMLLILKEEPPSDHWVRFFFNTLLPKYQVNTIKDFIINTLFKEINRNSMTKEQWTKVKDMYNRNKNILDLKPSVARGTIVDNIFMLLLNEIHRYINLEIVPGIPIICVQNEYNYYEQCRERLIIMTKK